VLLLGLFTEAPQHEQQAFSQLHEHNRIKEVQLLLKGNMLFDLLDSKIDLGIGRSLEKISADYTLSNDLPIP
jgi:hypothetical protein